MKEILKTVQWQALQANGMDSKDAQRHIRELHQDILDIVGKRNLLGTGTILSEALSMSRSKQPLALACDQLLKHCY